METNKVITILASYGVLIWMMITAFQVWLTFRMTQIMSRQTKADFSLSNIVLGCTFCEDWFREIVAVAPEILEDTQFEFILSFDVHNRNAGNGSISKPHLFLKFGNDNPEYKVSPITKVTQKEAATNILDKDKVDYGNTIFLRGGEFKNIELKYVVKNNKNLHSFLCKNIEKAIYHLEFKDNFERSNRIYISNITATDNVARY